MNKIFDYNGAAISHSRPVKQLKTVKKMLVVDSGDRDVQKYPDNGKFVVYLPRVYENVVSIRLAAAEFPNGNPVTASGDPPAEFNSNSIITYYILDIEGLNKIDECSRGADRSGYPDGCFAKIPTGLTDDNSLAVYYNDHSAQENIAHYTPVIGKLDRMSIKLRTHSQKQTTDYIYWNSDQFSLTFEIEMLDNVFDDFSSFESRIADRS